MYPLEGPPIWGGAILWRCSSVAKPFRTGASMALIGHQTQRVVACPITPTDPETGLATINWIAELTYDPSDGSNKEDWNREADKAAFLPKFTKWQFDRFDAPAVISKPGNDRARCKGQDPGCFSGNFDTGGTFDLCQSFHALKRPNLPELVKLLHPSVFLRQKDPRLF